MDLNILFIRSNSLVCSSSMLTIFWFVMKPPHGQEEPDDKAPSDTRKQATMARRQILLARGT